MMKFQGAKIESVKARVILDSRARPTVEVEMQVLGMKVFASVPSGTSVGKYEAKTTDPNRAVRIINRLAKQIVKKDFSSQQFFDVWLKKQSVFANVRLPLSIAFSRAFETLPKPKLKRMPKLLVLAFEGGVHGDSSLKVQEILLLARTLDQGLKFCSDLKEALKKKNIDTDVGLEGGFSPNNISDEQALEILVETFSKKAKIGLDFGGRYFQGQSETQDKLITSYPVFLAEDPFSEEDFKNWSGFFRKFGKKYLVVGDDLVATNVSRLKKNLKMGLINAVIVKPNQIGTVTDTLNFVKQARKNNLTIIVSHRSGETNDPFIADLAWAVSADYVKFGGLARGERIAKYNRLKELVLGSR